MFTPNTEKVDAILYLLPTPAIRCTTSRTDHHLVAEQSSLATHAAAVLVALVVLQQLLGLQHLVQQLLPAAGRLGCHLGPQIVGHLQVQALETQPVWFGRRPLGVAPVAVAQSAESRRIGCRLKLDFVLKNVSSKTFRI